MSNIFGCRQAAEAVRVKRVTASVCEWIAPIHIRVSPSGKASDSDSDIR